MAYSKQNFQNGQILNAANLEAMENGIIAGQGAENLLDNSDFTNAVNQRGATTATLGKYFIDGWGTEPFPSGPSITIDSNGLTLLPTTSSTAGIFQQIPDYEKRKGKIHTFAICVGNEWKCVSFTMGNFGVGYFIHGLAFFSVDNRNILIRNNVSDTPVPITIQRVALYEGSYTAETIPTYVPKGKHVEMLNCNVPLAPHNLLDNSDFRNPVNQRGQTTYTGSCWTIDRWRTWNNDATITLTSDGIKGDGTDASVLYQGIELHKIKLDTAYTVAVGYSDGTISCGAGTLTTSSSVGIWNNDAQACLLWNNDSPFIRLWHATKTIQWVVIYPGSYDASTLPAYQPKGYAAELAECMRYYQQYNTNEMSAVGNLESGITYIRCPLQVPMRTAPSLVQSSVDMWTTYNSTTNKTEAYTFYSSTPQLVNLKCTSSSGSAYQLVIAINNTAIGFSADL